MNKTVIRSVIDPHIHLFNLKQGKYDWLKPENSPFWDDKSLICKNTFEADLALYGEILLQAYVHIEAGFDNTQPRRELDWLREHGQLPFRAISYIDLSQAPAIFNEQIKQLNQYESFIGVRDIIDAEFVGKLHVNNARQNLQFLAQQNLIFELQVDFGQHEYIKIITELLASNVDLCISINHAGFAPFTDDLSFSDWQKTLASFAEFSKCVVKVSGMEMTCRKYSKKDMERVLNACCDIFGEQRVMLASNFPLVELGIVDDEQAINATEVQRLKYEGYWRNCLRVSDALGFDTDKLCRLNAGSFYRFI